jgi:hypothetical protein
VALRHVPLPAVPGVRANLATVGLGPAVSRPGRRCPRMHRWAGVQPGHHARGARRSTVGRQHLIDAQLRVAGARLMLPERLRAPLLPTSGSRAAR